MLNEILSSREIAWNRKSRVRFGRKKLDETDKEGESFEEKLALRSYEKFSVKAATTDMEKIFLNSKEPATTSQKIEGVSKRLFAK